MNPILALGEESDILLCENGRGTYWLLFQFESFSGHGSKALPVVAAPKLVSVSQPAFFRLNFVRGRNSHIQTVKKVKVSSCLVAQSIAL
jgi:hypothetical protein